MPRASSTRVGPLFQARHRASHGTAQRQAAAGRRAVGPIRLMHTGTTVTGWPLWSGQQRQNGSVMAWSTNHLPARHHVEVIAHQRSIRCHDRNLVAPGTAAVVDAPALVGAAVFGRGADREGGHLVEEEVEPVVVVKTTATSGLTLSSQRCTGGQPSKKASSRHRSAGFLAIGAADGGHVRGGDGADDVGHGALLLVLLLLLALLDQHGLEGVPCSCRSAARRCPVRPARRCRRTWRGGRALPPAASQLEHDLRFA